MIYGMGQTSENYSNTVICQSLDGINWMTSNNIFGDKVGGYCISSNIIISNTGNVFNFATNSFFGNIDSNAIVLPTCLDYSNNVYVACGMLKDPSTLNEKAVCYTSGSSFNKSFVETFDSNAIWTVPHGSSSFEVEVWSGGGAGGAGWEIGGGGGGGGGYTSNVFTLNTGDQYQITVGFGGKNGGNGGTSSFGNLISVVGGLAGGNNGMGGNGGYSTNLADVNSLPGNSGSGGTQKGGDGGNAGGPISALGGLGTAELENLNWIVSNDGQSPGGGGGGSGSAPFSNLPGGNGADGQVLINYSLPQMSWNKVYTGPGIIYAVKYVSSLQFWIAAGYDGSMPMVLYSPDLNMFMRYPIPEKFIGMKLYNFDFYNDTFYFCSDNYILSNIAFSSNWELSSYLNGKLKQIEINDIGSAVATTSKSLYFSSDLTTWQEFSVDGYGFNAVAYYNNLWIVSCSGYLNQYTFFFSKDGLTWNPGNNGVQVENYFISL